MLKIQTLTTRQVRSIGAAWNNATPLVSGAIYVAADDDGAGLDILVAALGRNEPESKAAMRERIKTELDAASRDVFEFGGVMVTP